MIQYGGLLKVKQELTTRIEKLNAIKELGGDF